MRQQIYAKNAAILTGTSLILRGAGMLFRVYIAARIGAAGMGLFQLIMTVYTLAVTFATAGVSVVATRITSEQMAVGNDGNVKQSIKRLIYVGIALSFAACVALIIAAPFIADVLLQDESACIPLQLLAPSLPFMAISSVLRGYFLAVKRVGPNAKGQMLEQTVRIIIVMALLYFMQGTSVLASVIAVVIGTTISEAISWLYLHICYKKSIKGFTGGKSYTNAKNAAKMLTPIAASQYVTGTLRTVENVIVPICLAMFLGSRDVAIEQFGALKGMAMPVLFFPFSFISTLATLLLPDITSAYIKKETKVLQRLVSRVLLLTLSVSVLAGGMYTVFASEISQILYKTNDITFYLIVLGPLAPFMYLESMVDGILKGMNEQVATFKYTLVDCVLRISLIYLLLPRMGMKGFLFVMLVSNLLTCTLNLQRLLKVAKIKFEWRQWIIGPAMAAVLAGVIWVFVALPFAGDTNMILRTVIGCGIFAVCYIASLPVFSGVNLLQFIKK